MAAERWPPPASLRCSPCSLRTQLGGRRSDVRLPLAVGPWTPGSGLRARPTARALGLCGPPAGASSGHSGAPVSLSEKRWEGAVPRPFEAPAPPRMGPAIMHSGWKRAKQPAGHPARRGAHSLTRRGGLRVSRARSAGDSKTKPGLQPRFCHAAAGLVRRFKLSEWRAPRKRNAAAEGTEREVSAGAPDAGLPPAQRPAPREGTPWAQRPCRPGPGPLGSVPTPGTRVRGTSVEGVRRGVDRIASFSPLCRRGRPGRLLAAPTRG